MATIDDGERARLHERLAQVRWALEQLRQRPHDAALFAETCRAAHDLAESAASFEELSEIAARLEQALVAWRCRGALAAAWAPIAGEDAALADREDRLAPAARPWRVVGASP